MPSDNTGVDPMGVTMEYVTARANMVNRYRGAGGSLLGNASKPTQLQFIEMCNQYAARFANQFPNSWNMPEWERLSGCTMPEMTRLLDNTFTRTIPSVSLTEYEAIIELTRTYLGLLRQRETP